MEVEEHYTAEAEAEAEGMGELEELAPMGTIHTRLIFLTVVAAVEVVDMERVEETEEEVRQEAEAADGEALEETARQ